MAGSVYAAAVILPLGYDNPELNDSKKLTEKRRNALREQIQRDAVAWAVGVVSPEEIDEINILHASFLAMHRAIAALSVRPQALIIDGNRFDPMPRIPRSHKADSSLPSQDSSLFTLNSSLPYACIVHGDAKYQAIAAASILAKTYRDDYMSRLDEEFPVYRWKKNKGYPTKDHRAAIAEYGITKYHRRSYNLYGDRQLELKFE